MTFIILYLPILLQVAELTEKAMKVTPFTAFGYTFAFVFVLAYGIDSRFNLKKRDTAIVEHNNARLQQEKDHSERMYEVVKDQIVLMQLINERLKQQETLPSILIQVRDSLDKFQK
jgi:Ca2+/H+ antiporter